MTSKGLVAIVCLFSVLATAQTISRTFATISGRAINNESAPLQGIVSLVDRDRPVPPFRVATQLDGTFALREIPPGSYSLCLQVPSQNAKSPDLPYVDSCEWPDFSKTLTIRDGEMQAGIVLVAQPGAILRVRLDDTLNLLPKPTNSHLFDSRLKVSIISRDNLHHELRPSGTQGSGRHLTTVVPRNLPLELSIKSDSLRILDETGRDITSKRPLLVGPTASLEVVTLSLRQR